jgi:adenylosuccinate synthase
MGATIIVDAFWGDAGKGKFCAFLSKELNARLSVRAGTGTNAGHSVYFGNKFISAKMLPLGWLLNPKTNVLISSGVAVDPHIFKEEIDKYGVSDRAFVDQNCPIIEQKHISFEEVDQTMVHIDSTKSGSGSARADYVLRQGKRANEISSLKKNIVDGITMINIEAIKGNVIIEGSQATFLSLYASDRYPYVTSDNCTTNAFLDDTSLSWKLLERVVLLVKCLPTCVGNGYLPFEMSEEEIRSAGLVEHGVNTGRFKRRSKKIDWNRLAYSVMINGPTEIALTFCDQFDNNILGTRKKQDITHSIKLLIDEVEKRTNIPVKYLSTGKDINDIIILH